MFCAVRCPARCIGIVLVSPLIVSCRKKKFLSSFETKDSALDMDVGEESGNNVCNSLASNEDEKNKAVM